jgi:mycothiol synthase
MDLLLASHRAGLADAEFRPSDILGYLSRPEVDLQRTTRVLTDDQETILAFGVLWRSSILGTVVRPDVHGPAEVSLIAWAESVVTGDVSVMIRDDNEVVIEHLLDMGYAEGFRELRMTRDLNDEVPLPDVPAGYVIRHLEGPQELPAWIDLYNHAFGNTSIPGPTTLERWQTRMLQPNYDPELNIVVFDGSGHLVSMCYCSIDQKEIASLTPKQGRTEPIATHALHRRNGLARAAILTGLHRLRERGIDEALLTTDSENVTAHQLYESLGYSLSYQAIWYRKAR